MPANILQSRVHVETGFVGVVDFPLAAPGVLRVDDAGVVLGEVTLSGGAGLVQLSFSRLRLDLNGKLRRSWSGDRKPFEGGQSRPDRRWYGTS